MKKLASNISQYKRFALFLPPILGALLIFFLGRQTLEHPLLEDHCVKTAKSVEVAYNMVRYGDAVSQYVDWRATPENPRGKQGTIFAYESPLSAYFLAGLYLIVDGADFDTRVKTTRYFTLFSLIGAYLLFWFFVFRKHLFAFCVFSFLLAYSFFAIYYSTKPQAETFSLVYQALFIGITARLMQSEKKIGFQMIALVGLVGLLVMGGKMNYFIVAFPVMAGFPLIADGFKNKRSKLFYYSCFGGVGLAALLILNLLPGFDLKQIFVYMIKGNKPIIENSLFATFIEGFDGFSIVRDRTRADYGLIAFYGGIIGFFYMVFKGIHLLVKRKKCSLTKFESSQVIILLVLLGHILNYVVLRNLFIPHRYYVVPLYTVICLALTFFITDVRYFVCNKTPVKDLITSKVDNVIVSLSSGSREFLSHRSTMLKTLWRLSFMVFCLGYVLHEFGDKIGRDEDFRSWYIHTKQYFGNKDLTFLLDKQALKTATLLKELGVIILVASACVAVIGAAASNVKKIASWNVIGTISNSFSRLSINTLSISFVAVLTIAGLFSILENTELFWSNAVVQQKNILLAESIEKVRQDTKSGELVICWKPCVAFYADKRSITEPNRNDLDYYIEHDIHSLLGPVQPLDRYYNLLKKYQRPATYYKLKETGKIENIRKLEGKITAKDNE